MLAGVGMGVHLAIWAAIAAIDVTFALLVESAGLLLLPYLAWGTFAGLLNFAIWYGRALPPDSAQNTKTREPESDCSRDLRTTRRSNRLRYFVGALMALLSPKLRRKFYVPEERQSFHIP